MSGTDDVEPLHDGTIIGSDLDRYLREDLDVVAPGSIEDAALLPEDMLAPPLLAEQPRADPEHAYLAANRSPNLAAKGFAYGDTSLLLTDPRHALIVMCNGAFLELTGYQYAEVVGSAPDALFAEPSGHVAPELRSALARSDRWRGEVWIKRRDGDAFPALVTVRTIRDSNGAPLSHVVTITDISVSKEVEERLRQLTLNDQLTGLVNRPMLADRLDESIANCRDSGTRLGVLFLNLDRFKLINDSLGHAAGDELLRQAAKRLRTGVRGSDTVARIGSDEFVVLLGDLEDSNAAAQIALKLGREIHRPYAIQGQEISVTTSIGISLFPNDGNDGNTLLQNADTAMHRAKELGRNRYVFYQREMTADVNHQFEMEKNLVLAIQRNEFVLHYQPQITIATGRIAGVEALIRWQHPQLGLIGPDRFIPIAEETGLIRTIGEWVIRQAGNDMRGWRDAGLPPLRMAINLSALQIARPQHTDALRSVLIAAGMAHADSGFDFEIEITESSLMTGENTMAAANALKGLGLTLAIDDFGTGYSSMMALRELPIDCIKIDKSFVKRLPDDPNDVAMTAAMIAMGKALGLRILAEGVETDTQLECLRRHGCDEAQGFLFSPAIPIDALQLLAVERNMTLLDTPR